MQAIDLNTYRSMSDVHRETSMPSHTAEAVMAAAAAPPTTTSTIPTIQLPSSDQKAEHRASGGEARPSEEEDGDGGDGGGGGAEESTTTLATRIPSTASQHGSLSIVILISSGQRTRFSITPAYLTKLNKTDGMQVTIGELKVLIWSAWPETWAEAKPGSEAYVRLIYLGKVLDDKITLGEIKIVKGAPNILHLSVRPADFPDDDQGKKE